MAKIIVKALDEVLPRIVRSAVAELDEVDVEHAVTSNEGFDPVSASELAASEPDLVIIGPGFALDVACDYASAIDEANPMVSTVIVGETDPDSWRDVLRSGARDLLDPQADIVEVRECIERMLRRSTDLHSHVPGTWHEPSGGRVIALSSPKGGSGKTMMATNLAYALNAEHPGEVVIVDFDLQFGDVGAALRLQPEYTVSNAMSALGDPVALKAFLTPHPSGFYCLPAPLNPVESDSLKSADLGKLIEVLAGEFPWVVVDTGAGLDESGLTAVEKCTDLLMVTTTDLASIQALRRTVKILDTLHLNAHRRWLVLNRADARVGLSASDIEQALELELTAQIPSSRDVPMAMNQGSPVLENQPYSKVSKALSSFAHMVDPSANDSDKSRFWTFGRQS